MLFKITWNESMNEMIDHTVENYDKDRKGKQGKANCVEQTVCLFNNQDVPDKFRSFEQQLNWVAPTSYSRGAMQLHNGPAGTPN